MKKIISSVLVCIMLASLLAGCGGGTLSNGSNGGTLPDGPSGGTLSGGSNDTLPDGSNGGTTSDGMNSITLPDGLSGSDAAKLLLANERLNAQLLKTEGDIFENGVEVMNDLAETAIANLNVRYVGNSTPIVTNLSAFQSLSTVIEGDYSGKLEIDGDTFIWSGFEENNNSYDAFKSTTEGIVYTAKLGAELIDNVKKNVRVVDKWVDVGEAQYYLSVDENSETLFERRLSDNNVTICKRYKNEDGDDVYELYSENDKYKERCTYIPGKRYERSSINDHGDHAENYFVADSSKGYWETYTVGALPTHYNVSYFIMKDDICYDAFYNPMDGSIPLLKVMSADKATDIINFSDYGISVKFSGFDGIKSVEAPARDVDYVEGEYANLSQFENAKVYLTNGRVLNCGESFVDGKVTILAIYVGYSGGFGYTGEIDLNIRGETDVEILEYLRSFLNEVGLQCRRNIDGVFAGIHRAYIEMDSIIPYYTWNGVSVADESGIGEAISLEMARFGDMKALYTAVKDAEVLDISNTELVEINIKFAPVTQSGFEGVTLDGGRVSIGSISLSVEDTLLYVADESYKIMLALADENGGLVHLDVENTSSTKYADEDKFTVTASQLYFTLPVLSSGSYTAVAYIATSDGIRASAYTPVTVSEILNMPINIQRMTVSAEKSEQNALALSYEQAKDFTVDMTTESRVGYEEFKTLVSQRAFEYGIPSDTVEVMSGDTYTALTGSETEIADGTYRIFYETENGAQVVQGYIYVQYACK